MCDNNYCIVEKRKILTGLGESGVIIPKGVIEKIEDEDAEKFNVKKEDLQYLDYYQRALKQAKHKSRGKPITN